MVVLFDREPHVVHHRKHLRSEIALAVDRRHREIAALDRRAVAGIAVGEVLVGDVGALLAVDLVHRPFHRGGITHVVEDEELGLRPEIGLVAESGGDQVLLGLLGDRTRVAGIGLPGQRLMHIAKDDQRRLGGKRVENRGRAVRHQHHVRLVDRLPAGDRRTVEHHALVQEIFVDRPDVVSQMLPLAARIGEPEVDVFDVVLLDQIHDFLGVSHCNFPFDV